MSLISDWWYLHQTVSLCVHIRFGKIYAWRRLFSVLYKECSIAIASSKIASGMFKGRRCASTWSLSARQSPLWSALKGGLQSGLWSGLTHQLTPINNLLLMWFEQLLWPKGLSGNSKSWCHTVEKSRGTFRNGTPQSGMLGSENRTTQYLNKTTFIHFILL